MVNTRSSNVRRREDQDASVIARVIAPNEQGPQPLEDPSKNQEESCRLSIMAEVQQMFRDMVDKNREQIHKIIEEKMGSIRPTGCSYKMFLSCQPPEFSGSTDPSAILNWITEMEMTFDCYKYEEDKKVMFAVRMLKGNAFSWWDMTRVMLGNEVMSNLTWANFVERVKRRYCSESDFNKMGREFFSLENGNMTIDEYACLFTEKLKYVDHLARNDKACVDRFVAGLPFEYLLAGRRAKTLDSAIQAAKLVEDLENEEGEDVREKRKWEGTFGSSKKSKVEDKSCYRCGQVGHLARACQTRL